MAKQAGTLRQRLRDATAEAMLEAAERAMVKKGYEATMQEIAAKAGCAAGTFYLYFKSKEELFEAILARHGSALFEAARAAMEEVDDPLEKVRRGVQCHLRYIQHHRPFFRLFFTAMPMRQRMLHAGLSPRIRQEYDSYNQMELEAIRAAQEKGQVRRDMPAEILQQCMDAVGFHIVEEFLFAGGKMSVREQMDIIWGLITGGIGARSRYERS